MKKRDIQMFVFLMLIWIALNESARPFTLIVGLFVCVYSVNFTNKFLKADFSKEFYVHPWNFFKYCLYIVKEIYLAGYDMLKRIFTGDVHPAFMEYESHLKNDLPNVILANSITSTPGTITIHREQNRFVILSANPDEESVLSGVRDGMEKKISVFDEREEN